MIPNVGTKVVWPTTSETAISYCRLLLHDAILKSDAFRTGISTSSTCECGYHSETVEHNILHCPKYNSTRLHLTDMVESLRQDVRDNRYTFDKLHFVVAPRSDDIISKKEDLFLKYALFDFLISTKRDLKFTSEFYDSVYNLRILTGFNKFV